MDRPYLRIIERYIPSQIKPMRAANQQRWRLDFSAINRLHVPAALASMLLVVIVFGRGLLRRPSMISRCSPGRFRWPCSATRLFAP